MKSIINYLLVLFFFIFIAVPGLSVLYNDTELVSQNEKRKLKPFPMLESINNVPDITTFFKDIELFVKDRFGFRENFIDLYTKYQIATGGNPYEHIWQGKNDWFFYATQNDGNTINDSRKVGVYSVDEINRWKSMLLGRKLYLKQRSIEYYFVIAPNKHSVYPEMLPRSLYPVDSNHKSKVKQLNDFFENEYIDFRIIDPTLDLTKRKDLGQLYNKTGTHWNLFGAYYATQYLFNHMSQIDTSSSEFAVKKVLTWKENFDDRGDRLGAIHDLAPYFNELFEIEYEKIDIDNKSDRAYATQRDNKEKTVLMFRDSFGTAMAPYLSNSFNKIYYVWTRPNHGKLEMLVAKIKPDIVIEERAERYMSFVPKTTKEYAQSSSLLSNKDIDYVINNYIKSDKFLVDINNGRLIYYSDSCSEKDLNSRVFLHIYPAEVPSGQRNKYDNWDGKVIIFSMTEKNNACYGVIELPKYKINKIVTGLIFEKQRIWSKVLKFQ